MMNEKIRIAVRALDSKKAMDLRLLRVDSLTSLADYFLFCSGTSVTQVKALADECEYQMKEAGYPVSHREGRESGNWILLDFGDHEKIQKLDDAFYASRVTNEILFPTAAGPCAWTASVCFGGPDLKTVYIGALKETSIPFFRTPVAGLPMVHWNEAYRK